MNLDQLSFWQDWPAPRQRAFFRLLLWGWAAVLVLAWFILAGNTRARIVEADALASRHRQIKPMIDELLRLKAQKGALAAMGAMPAAQQVIRELGLEPKLSSIRPTQVAGGGEGVQIVLEALNLPDLLKLLDNLDTRGGLKFFSFNLSHRMDNQKLADLQLVLGR